MSTATQASRSPAAAGRDSGDQNCQIIDPGAKSTRDAVAVVPPLRTLKGRRLAVLDITKVRSDAFVDQVESYLRGREETLQTERGVAPPSQRLSDAELRETAERCDGAVLALADCGTCTAWTLFDAIELHRYGCRSVIVTTEALRPTVAALCSRLGMDELPVVEVTLPNRDQSRDQIVASARAAAPAIEAALLS